MAPFTNPKPIPTPIKPKPASRKPVTGEVPAQEKARDQEKGRPKDTGRQGA